MPTVALPALVAHAAAALLIASVPVAAWFWLRRRFGLAWRDIGVGAAVFVVFALVLERTLHLYLLQLNPTTAHWLRMPALFVIYGALMAGVFEQSGAGSACAFSCASPGMPPHRWRMRSGTPASRLGWSVRHRRRRW